MIKKHRFWFSVYLGRKTTKNDIITQLDVMNSFFEYKSDLILYAKEGLPYMFMFVKMYMPRTFPSAVKICRIGSLGRLSAATCMQQMITNFNMKKYTVDDRITLRHEV